MKTNLKIEELAQLLLGVVFLTPDIGMLGYLVNTKVGAFTYNLFHHKGIAILVMLLGYFYLGQVVTLIGVILFAHSAFDRMLGYGLKYSDSFKNTHLGAIGKK